MRTLLPTFNNPLTSKETPCTCRKKPRIPSIRNNTEDWVLISFQALGHGDDAWSYFWHLPKVHQEAGIRCGRHTWPPLLHALFSLIGNAESPQCSKSSMRGSYGISSPMQDWWHSHVPVEVWVLLTSWRKSCLMKKNFAYGSSMYV